MAGGLAKAYASKKPAADEAEDSSAGDSSSESTMKGLSGDELAAVLGLSGSKAERFLSALESYVQSCKE